jgi:hypothetical protein
MMAFNHTAPRLEPPDFLCIGATIGSSRMLLAIAAVVPVSPRRARSARAMA